jgi:sirohydrochlorin ferrochelatase
LTSYLSLGTEVTGPAEEQLQPRATHAASTITGRLTEENRAELGAQDTDQINGPGYGTQRWLLQTEREDAVVVYSALCSGSGGKET